MKSYMPLASGDTCLNTMREPAHAALGFAQYVVSSLRCGELGLLSHVMGVKLLLKV